MRSPLVQQACSKKQPRAYLFYPDFIRLTCDIPISAFLYKVYRRETTLIQGTSLATRNILARAASRATDIYSDENINYLKTTVYSGIERRQKSSMHDGQYRRLCRFSFPPSFALHTVYN